MMKKRLQKTICSAAVTVMAGVLLTGCSQKNKNKDAAGNAVTGSENMGRYIESDVSLPDEKEDYIDVRQTDDGRLELYATESVDKKLTFLRYIQSEDGTWGKETIAEFPSEDAKSVYSQEYLVNKNGDEYIYYNQSSDKDGSCYLYKHKNDTWEPVTIEGWNEYDKENDYHKTPWGLGLLDDGSIIASYDGDVNLYSPDTGKVTKSLDYNQQNGYENFRFFGDDVVFIELDKSTYRPKNICRYNITQDSLLQIPYTSDESYNSQYFYVNPADNDFYLFDNEGVQKYQTADSSWKKIVDGSLTSLYLPSLGIIAATMTPDNDYYVLAYMDSDIHLLKYSYDPSIPSVPAQELTVYSLHECALLRQAIVSFQKSHPDVRVTMNTVMSDSDEDSKDYIQALNTSLLAGEGDDILLLDGLPYTAFQEKGVLTDISDIIQPMTDSGELLNNVMNSFQKDGKYYYAPAKFSLMMEYGNKDSADCTTLDAIIDYAKAHTEPPILGSITSTTIINTFLPVYLNSVTNEDGTLSESGVTELFQKLKELFDLAKGVSVIKDAKQAEETYTSIFDLPGHAIMNVSETYGFMDDSFNLAVVNFIKGNFNNFEHSYRPNIIVGINNNSKKQDLAKEFLKLLFSEEVQSCDLFDGYSVNSKVIDKIMDAESGDAYTEIEDAHGNYVPFSISTPSKEYKQKLIDLCKTSTLCLNPDITILKKVSDAAEQYLADNDTLENTVKNLINELSLYAEE